MFPGNRGKHRFINELKFQSTTLTTIVVPHKENIISTLYLRNKFSWGGGHGIGWLSPVIIKLIVLLMIGTSNDFLS